MLRQRRIRRLNFDISCEFTDVVRARGLVLEPVGGTLDPNQIYLAPGCREGSFLLDLIPRHIIMRLVGPAFQKLKSSMPLSFERQGPRRFYRISGMDGSGEIRRCDDWLPTVS